MAAPEHRELDGVRRDLCEPTDGRETPKEIHDSERRSEVQVPELGEGFSRSVDARLVERLVEPWLVGAEGLKNAAAVLDGQRSDGVEVSSALTSTMRDRGESADDDELDLRVREDTQNLTRPEDRWSRQARVRQV